MPKPCIRCGEPKQPGRGYRYCLVCERIPNRRTQTPCHACGSTENKQPGRHYCDECKALRDWRAEKRATSRSILERRPCKGCGRRKSPGKGKSYCDACTAKRNRPLMCRTCKDKAVRAPGKRICAECYEASRARVREKERLRGRGRGKEDVRRRSREHKQRLKQDPIRYARLLETQRMRYRLRHGLHIRALNVTSEEPTVWLPSLPLARVVDAAAETSDLHSVCGSVGIVERQVTRWRTGESPVVSLVEADRVMTSLDVLWWEVWSEDTVRRPLFVVHEYAHRLKKTRNDRKLMRLLRRTVPYGDLGPDTETLLKVEALMTGEAVAA